MFLLPMGIALQTVRAVNSSLPVLKDQGALWAELSAEEVAAVRQELVSSLGLRFFSVFKILTLLLGGIVGAALMAAVCFYYPPDSKTGAWIFGVAASAVMSCLFEAFGWPRVAKNLLLRKSLLEQLDSATSQPHGCAMVLDRLERSEELRQYRDTIVSGGRELLVLDLNYLYVRAAQISDELLDEHTRLQNEATFKKLHGVA